MDYRNKTRIVSMAGHIHTIIVTNLLYYMFFIAAAK
jgi:hypothetical protein